MGDSGVYNSTTISYENPSGGLSMSSGNQRRPWSLSEMVSPPTNRSRWFHWMLLMGGSIIVGLGLIVTIIGIYNQHYYNPDSQIVVRDEDESPPSHWIITLMGITLVILGMLLLVIYCKLVNTNRMLCNPLSRTRSALRQVVTKPRYQNGQTSQGTNLLSNDGVNNSNPMSTQYDPVPDMGFRQANGDVTSEEKAKLMAHEVKAGSVSNSTTAAANLPRRVLSRRSPSPTPPVRPMRQFSSLRRYNDIVNHQFHYKPRHFSGHGYGQGRLPSALSMHKAPLASVEDMTPSLRSSFASVMMYPPSDWGNSDDSFDSTIFLNLPPTTNDDQDREGQEEEEDTDDLGLDEFKVSPSERKSSLSSLSIQSAFS